MENNFAGKGTCSLSLPRSQGKIEKSFSPKLTDYFIQGVRKPWHIYQKLYCFLQSMPWSDKENNKILN
jgi:hypothetical protein